MSRSDTAQSYAQEHYVDQWQQAVDDYYLNYYVRHPEYLEMLPEQVQLAISTVCLRFGSTMRCP